MAGLRYVEHRPRPELRPYLECLWLAEDTRARSRLPERVVPDACPELIVHLADRFTRQRGSRFVRQPRAFLAGTLVFGGKCERYHAAPGQLTPGQQAVTTKAKKAKRRP